MTATVTDYRHRLAARLREAIERQPSAGRQRGMRLFQRRMDEHGQDVGGTSLRAIQDYLAARTEPSPSFLRLAAQLTGVRFAWLANGEGMVTEEEERERVAGQEAELGRITGAVYRALGRPFWDAQGTAAALWAPTVRRVALRLYQHRPAWRLFEGLTPGDDGGRPGDPGLLQGLPETGDAEFSSAVEAVAEALAAPLRALGMDGRRLSLQALADYVELSALALHQAIPRYHAEDVPPGHVIMEVPALVESLLDVDPPAEASE